MRGWLRALAWRLLGIRLIPVAKGDVLLLTVPLHLDVRSAHFVGQFITAMSDRGVKVNVLVDDTALTAVLYDRAHGT